MPAIELMNSLSHKDSVMLFRYSCVTPLVVIPEIDLR